MEPQKTPHKQSKLEKEESYSMRMDVIEIYCGDHFAIQTNIESLYIESLHCIPETNAMLYVNYSSIKIIIINK